MKILLWLTFLWLGYLSCLEPHFWENISQALDHQCSLGWQVPGPSSFCQLPRFRVSCVELLSTRRNTLLYANLWRQSDSQKLAASGSDLVLENSSKLYNCSTECHFLHSSQKEVEPLQKPFSFCFSLKCSWSDLESRNRIALVQGHLPNFSWWGSCWDFAHQYSRGPL
jgi:hypothetical protein